MSDRHKEHKGSSRSSRDDYRKDKDNKESAGRTRTRSRSPRRKRSSPPVQRHARKEETKPRDSDLENQDRQRHSDDSWEESDEEVPAPPPPPRISKITMGFTKPSTPIKMTLGASSKSVMPKPTVASVFNHDDDDEPEEMPAEAKMRMRNIGRETPTSAGPNSFGKTKQGFCDAKKVFEKNLKEALETAEKPATKFPQTIYKIKGP
ncbi:PEST proteolytic signal-containing nuclear protein-like [Pararge aegeria]|uniref:PEST proteolytic signal-containing nuclear protein n=2 Tax=Pararge aegeria TaxID=116150 RepID=A0A8S4R6C0_9NEOP|nr:PEST proteolytic signal-containing nuclear protein-like [Pararge aegeria]CAH2232374.1 jg15312 [Pararge aegeria aegeria]